VSESKGFPYFKEVGIGALSGVAALALLIGGFSISGAATNNNTNQPSGSSSVVPSGTPTATVAACSVKDLAEDPLLGELHAVVVNAATDTVLFDRSADLAAPTGSTLKLLTATAALQTFGPNYRFDTRVMRDAADPSVVYLVGGGDVTLSRTKPGLQSVYKNAPKLNDLAVQVNAAFGTTGTISKIVVDGSYFTGSQWEPTWERSEQTKGYMSQVSALQVDGDRNDPTKETSTRSTKPELRAGGWFKQAIGAVAANATIVQGVTPPNATQVAKVSSQPLSNWILHMLQVSDNTQAEALARLVSLKQGFDGSFASIDPAFKQALKAANLDATGSTIRDGSGLSFSNAVSPIFMTKVVNQIYKGVGNFMVIKQSLPVAGETGSLGPRFKGELADASGKIFAKTGWLKQEYALAGYYMSADGSASYFAVYSIGDKEVDTKNSDAMDKLVAGFFRCGQSLGNE
jgi:D-alanyl-D-alanine carboxypeptidase/D-alanyl-D-alanine-endopeptidase (penicillin-binding protein 4)